MSTDNCLQLDVGNSSAKWRLLDDGKIIARGKYITGDDDSQQALLNCAARVGRAWISSVASAQAEAELSQLLTAQWGVQPWFARTPALESLRMVPSYAVMDLAGQPPKSWAPYSTKRMQISLVDVSRAYSNAPTDDSNPTNVDLPIEVGEPPGT